MPTVDAILQNVAGRAQDKRVPIRQVEKVISTGEFKALIDAPKSREIDTSATARPFSRHRGLQQDGLAPFRRGGPAHESRSAGRIAIVFKTKDCRIPPTYHLRKHEAQVDIRVRDCLG